MNEAIDFTPAHRLPKSLLRSGPGPDQRGILLSSMEWRSKLDESGPLNELLDAALRAARWEADRAAGEMQRAMDASVPTRQRQSAAMGAAFKTACLGGLWELAQWRFERSAETTEATEGGKKLEAIAAIGAMAMGSLGALAQRLLGEGEREILESAQRVDGMVGFAFCHETMVQWRVLEERRQLDEETLCAGAAPKAASPRI